MDNNVMSPDIISVTIVISVAYPAAILEA